MTSPCMELARSGRRLNYGSAVALVGMGDRSQAMSRVQIRAEPRGWNCEPGRLGERFGEPMAQFLVWLSPEWRITPKQWEATQGIPRTRRQGAWCGGEPRK